MANADIRAAAERIGSLFAETMEGESGIQVTSQRMCDYVTLARAYLDGPRWHDTPPVPGLYVKRRHDRAVAGTTVVRVEFPGRVVDGPHLWYGPIPEDTP